MENKKIKIDLGFATLVVEAGNDQMKEVYVGLQNNKGAWFQDLAVIGQQYHIEGDNIAYEEGIRVRVLLIKTTRTTLMRSISASSTIKTNRG